MKYFLQCDYDKEISLAQSIKNTEKDFPGNLATALLGSNIYVIEDVFHSLRYVKAKVISYCVTPDGVDVLAVSDNGDVHNMKSSDYKRVWFCYEFLAQKVVNLSYDEYQKFINS